MVHSVWRLTALHDTLASFWEQTQIAWYEAGPRSIHIFMRLLHTYMKKVKMTQIKTSFTCLSKDVKQSSCSLCLRFVMICSASHSEQYRQVKWCPNAAAFNSYLYVLESRLNSAVCLRFRNKLFKPQSKRGNQKLVSHFCFHPPSSKLRSNNNKQYLPASHCQKEDVFAML